jgi:hypothetical protein
VNERLREALRRKIAQHNRLVTLSTLAFGTAVVAMWCGLYFVVWWLTVLGATVVEGLEAEVPRGFHRIASLSFVAWLIAGWIARARGFFERPRTESSSGAAFLEVLLTPPRATFAVLQNIRNRIRFNEEDLIAATDFLVRVVRSGKLPVSAVPVELPDESRRDRVLTGLQLLDLVYIRKKGQEAWVAVCHPQRLIKFVTPTEPAPPLESSTPRE